MITNKKIMGLIEIGDPLLIFSENYSIIETFNKLLKFHLIDIINGQVVLTQKGEGARTVGFDKALAKLQEEEIKEIRDINQKCGDLLISLF